MELAFRLPVDVNPTALSKTLLLALEGALVLGRMGFVSTVIPGFICIILRDLVGGGGKEKSPSLLGLS